MCRRWPASIWTLSIWSWSRPARWMRTASPWPSCRRRGTNRDNPTDEAAAEVVFRCPSKLKLSVWFDSPGPGWEAGATVNQDIDAAMRGWDYKPGVVQARLVQAGDGR